jgi:hypothetical protein
VTDAADGEALHTVEPPFARTPQADDAEMVVAESESGPMRRGDGPRAVTVLAAIGSSDCELIRNGAIAQPFNTWSSLAYVVAGALVIARRKAWDLDGSAVVFGGIVVAVGIGSVAFHAAADGPARWLHDTSLLTALAFIAGWEVGALVRRPPGRVACCAAVGAVIVAGSALAYAPDATDAGVALLVGVAAAAYVVQRARTHGRLSWGDVPFVAVALVAGAAFFLGRTGSFACHPTSWFQYHGLWHMGTAVLAVVWAMTSLPASRRAGDQSVAAHG